MQLVRHRTPQPSIASLGAETALEFLYQMVLIRTFEDRAAEMYAQDKIAGFLHLYTGQEACAVGAIAAIRDSDVIVTHYRDHGHALARGIDAGPLMAELYGKVDGIVRGRGGSMHFFSAQHNLLGGWAIVGGHIALAVGVAFGMRYRSRDDLVLCIFGDGATNQGYFHESLNMAALWRLPVVLFCENNLYGMGGAVERVSAVTAMARKACAYDIPAQTVDGMDVAAVYRACMQAVEHVRSGRGPYFIEAETYRFRGHSMADPGLYRTKEEEQQWRQRDPIERLRLELGRTGALDDAAFGEVERRAAKAVDEAVRFAESSPAPDISELTRYTYAREAEHG